jgi:muramoyltetrapeptide carboxypeptidase LdcA involved in peptidoglycan recycling
MYNLNFGHNAPMCVLPLGVEAQIDCDAKTLKLVEAGVE